MRTSKPRSGLLVAIALGVAGIAHATAPERYNVLLVSIDSLRRDAVGCYGSTLLRGPHVSPTPNLDRIAAAGVRMADAYANSSWTLPSHVSLLVGQPTIVHQVESDMHTLDARFPTLAEILRDAGYRTAGVFSGPLERARPRGARRVPGPLPRAAGAHAPVDAGRARAGAARALEGLGYLDDGSVPITPRHGFVLPLPVAPASAPPPH